MSVKLLIKRLLAQSPGTKELVGIKALKSNWNFQRSSPDIWTLKWRASLRRRSRPAPNSVALRRVQARKRWILYFIYTPDGRLGPAHRFTLEQLRASTAGLMVVCAAPALDSVPEDLFSITDALYWKEMSGFDFSAYSIGLRELALRSSGSDILVLNDSVFGPFNSVDTLWDSMKWDLTGFTASGLIQNHIQSYAFMLRDWTERKLNALSSVFPQDLAYNDYDAVVFRQETRFATEASAIMSVGACWYADHRKCADPTIFAALPLLRAGFPFVKKSLLTKHAATHASGTVAAAIRAAGHPEQQTSG